jgi:superfamily II DNA/RNA helicase
MTNVDSQLQIFPDHIITHFERDLGQKPDFIRKTLEEYHFDRVAERVLVFVHRRKDAEKFADEFGEGADYFHAGRDSSEKEEVASRFKNGDISILFATKAFGMGVDIKNIRYVFHTMPPSSIEDYIQEIGRAGRDYKQSHAFLPYLDDDFNDVRSRLIKTQLHWSMVEEMHGLLQRYRDTLTGKEQGSFIIPDDLVATEPTLNHNLFGQNAATTRQRMLLHSLEEAERIEVAGFEMTHWPVTLGERTSNDETSQTIRTFAAKRGATQKTKTLIAERDIRQLLELDNDIAAREQLFYASKTGAICIPFEVAIDWTTWAKDEKTASYIDAVLDKSQSFLRKVLKFLDIGGEPLVIAHAEIHPSYLSDSENKKKHYEVQPAETRFDERKPSLIRFLRRVDGLRVTGNKLSATYHIIGSDQSNKQKDSKAWRDTLDEITKRAISVVDYMRRGDFASTIDALYKAADTGLGKMRIKDLELTLHYLAALGIVRLSNELIPSAVRVEIKPAFAEKFSTPSDKKACEELQERNHLRISRCDALQVLTRTGKDREAYARKFFDASSVSDARQVVREKAFEVDSTLLQQFDAMALEEYFKKLNPEQQEVVCAAQIENVIVQAGPGTGKTHTLINCVAQRLIASEKIERGRNPNGPISASSILVLAYNRAVVEELRSRLRVLLELLGRKETPQIHTFHSYALRKLDEHGRHNVKMDNAIIEFTETFGANGLSNPPAHIFVDEFQDINDDRARMLKAILKRSPGSLITAIGDSDQSIYEFDKKESRKHKSEDYFAFFVKRFAAKQISLSINYRSDQAILDSANAIFPRNLTASSLAGDGEVIHTFLSEKPVVEAANEALSAHRDVAVLFRWNAELYRELPNLKKISDVNIRILGGQGRIVYSREINEALIKLESDYPHEQCSEALVGNVLSQVWKDAWEDRLGRHLKDGADLFAQSGQNRTILNFVEWVRDDLPGHHLLYASQKRQSETTTKELILSTMHRTKGLEFDSVIITPSDSDLKAKEIPEEKRLRYVAVTRAKHRLVFLDGPREKALEAGIPFTFTINNNRFGTRFDTIDPDGAGAFKLSDFSFHQQYLLNEIREGDALIIRNNALWHEKKKLCKISAARTDLHGKHFDGIFVTEVVRLDGFGVADTHKRHHMPDAQKRGWSYVVNAAGYLNKLSSNSH